MTGTGSTPSLGAHRLIGAGRGAALVRNDAVVVWWCPDRFEAAPTLWSLLDRRGAQAACSAGSSGAWASPARMGA